MSKPAYTAKRSTAPKLRVDDFQYLLDEDLPKLILGIRIPAKSFENECFPTNYQFASGREWRNIAHETAGAGRHQHYFIATFLKPKSLYTVKSMEALATKWFDSHVGVTNATLNHVNDYRHCIKALFHAHCNHSYPLFEEGLYPIDHEYLSELTEEVFPKDLDDLIVWRDGWHRAQGAGRRFTLAILGKNGD